MRRQGRTSTNFAQVSPPRLSETCRNSFLIFHRASRSDDPFLCWATHSLAQARMARISDVAMRHVAFYMWILVQARCGVLSEWGSHLGERVLPKREIVVSPVSHSLKRGSPAWAREMHSLEPMLILAYARTVRIHACVYCSNWFAWCSLN